MRFVDEYRDAEKARALAAKIAGLCEPGRQYKFMEVCGGHTHTIYKHGLEDYLPETITLVHGPGCPVCVIPMGRVDDAIHIARQPGVLKTSFGDMTRVPGPGHVSTVIGCRPYEFIAGQYGRPVVVAGLEPLDILQSIYMLMLQLAQGRCEVENQYSRVVPWQGNPVALRAIGEVMELRPYF